MEPDMDNSELNEAVAFRKLLEQVAAASVFEHAKALYDLGVRYIQSGDMAVAAKVLEAAFEIGDPFYAAHALLSLADIQRNIGATNDELNTYKRISGLDDRSRRFIAPRRLAVVYQKLGDFATSKQLFQLALRYTPNDPSILANLGEVLLIAGEFHEVPRLVEPITSLPQAKYLIMGRLLRGASNWFLDQRRRAVDDFRSIGQFLLANGSVPEDMNWDFRDAKPVLQHIDSPTLQLILQVLTKQIAFEDFRGRWAALEPASVAS